jgi:hypothetical protein
VKAAICAAAAALILLAGLSAQAQTIVAYRHLILDGHALKWGKPVLGTGAAVTYALVDKGMRFAGARNCSSVAPLDKLLSRSGIGAASFVHELEEALRVWEATADISFSLADPAKADILIGAQVEPVGHAFANVEYDKTETGTGPRSISRSTVCFNPLKSWKVGFDGDLDVYDVRYTLIHEIGHAIGLDHPAIAGQLMAYKYGEKFRALQAGDIRGIETLYGPRRATPNIQVGAIRPQQAEAQ